MGDLFDSEGSLLNFKTLQARGVANGEFMLYNSLVHAMPVRWKNLLKIEHDLISYPIMYKNGIGNQLDKLKVNIAYKALMSQRVHIIPTGQQRYSEQFKVNETEWENIYLLPRLVSKDNYLRDFQFKILHRYLATNKLLKRYNISVNARCTFCELQNETIEHILFECNVTRHFWFDFIQWWKQYSGETIILNLKDVLFGYQYQKPPKLLNNIILQAKKFIYKSKLHLTHPNIKRFYVEIQCKINEDLLL